MRILLLGAAGQLGYELERALSAVGEVSPATRSGFVGARRVPTADLADPSAVAALVESTAPDWVVNAGAYTAVDRAESEPALAHRINGDAVGAIGAAAARVGAKVLHYSTDYVFDGRASAPQRESDPVDPVNEYGRSKLAGERALAASGAEHLVFRTAWVHASRGQNFVRTMLKLATREKLAIVADQRGSPTSARWLAQASAQAIARVRDGAAARGIFHATCAGETTWFDFATAIFETAHAEGLVKRVPTLAPIATADYPTPAARPAYSVLAGDALERAFGIHRAEWQVGLAQVMAELAEIARAADRP